MPERPLADDVHHWYELGVPLAAAARRLHHDAPSLTAIMLAQALVDGYSLTQSHVVALAVALGGALFPLGETALALKTVFPSLSAVEFRQALEAAYPHPTPAHDESLLTATPEPDVSPMTPVECLSACKHRGESCLVACHELHQMFPNLAGDALRIAVNTVYPNTTVLEWAQMYHDLDYNAADAVENIVEEFKHRTPPLEAPELATALAQAGYAAPDIAPPLRKQYVDLSRDAMAALLTAAYPNLAQATLNQALEAAGYPAPPLPPGQQHVFMPQSGSGTIQIDAHPGTLVVVYEIGDSTPPAKVCYANLGGNPNQPLPQGISTFEVPYNSFHLSYDMGACTSIKLAWWYTGVEAVYDVQNVIIVDQGVGDIQIDAQRGTLMVGYGVGDKTPPKTVLYGNEGHRPDQALPEGVSSFEVPRNSFQLSYDMGDCRAMKLAWWYTQ